MTKKKKTWDDHTIEMQEIFRKLDSEELIKEFNRLQSNNQLEFFVVQFDRFDYMQSGIHLKVISDELIKRKYKPIEFTYWIKDLIEETDEESPDWDKIEQKCLKMAENLKESMNKLTKHLKESKPK